ncbi:response regulator transcription factor [Aliikangiella coralliicola]|uniref:Response regulator transcription factor n=1 Tax=Aliikangiella coralliicola TaxID=2592383 RepID=A0A545UG84_9GAMM|nr:response regulator transcription factor [Aliikangiella coralliicola]TQV88486.1 response regulator transcription factor [Aliikangiella coralliicola]
MNILMIEEQPAYSLGFKSMLQSTFSLHTYAMETGLEEGLKQIQSDKTEFDIVFIGVNDLSLNILNHINHNSVSALNTPIIVLSSVNDKRQSKMFLNAGITSVISKKSPQAVMLKSIRTVLSNQNALTPSLKDQPVHIKEKNTPIKRPHETSQIYDVTQSHDALSRRNTKNRNDSAHQSNLDNTCFEFNVSADEEHTFLSVEHSGENFDFGERVHHYLLLILARQRLQDYQQGFEESSQGWVEISDLQNMLRLDYCHLNIHIFRARQQINKKMSTQDNPVEVLERRTGSIRFAGKICRIIRAGRLESAYQISDYDSTECSPGYSKVIGGN